MSLDFVVFACTMFVISQMWLLASVFAPQSDKWAMQRWALAWVLFGGTITVIGALHT